MACVLSYFSTAQHSLTQVSEGGVLTRLLDSLALALWLLLLLLCQRCALLRVRPTEKPVHHHFTCHGSIMTEQMAVESAACCKPKCNDRKTIS